MMILGRKPKFKTGDTVKIINPERWAYGCLATVSGWFPTEKAAPYYLVKLINSPNPYISTSYVTEDDLEGGFIIGRRMSDLESGMIMQGEL